MTPVVACLIYPVVRDRTAMPSPYDPLTAPTFAEVALWIAIAHLHNDLGFYWSHRTFHHKPFYKRFHKQHHSFVGTISPATEFAHPVEDILSNILPTIGGIVFFGRPHYALWVWLVLRLQQTYETHSGYCLSGTWLDFVWITHGDEAQMRR